MIFIGLGSNLGDKHQHLAEALAQLEAKSVQVKRVSPYYQTAPWGKKNQDDFLNAVAEVAYDGSPQELLQLILRIELMMGRQRDERWGPRIIDLDILEFNRQQVNEPGLKLPHPYYPERSFVLAPLADLEPEWVPTGQSLTVSELLKALGAGDIQRLESVPS